MTLLFLPPSLLLLVIKDALPFSGTRERHGEKEHQIIFTPDLLLPSCVTVGVLLNLHVGFLTSISDNHNSLPSRAVMRLKSKMLVNNQKQPDSKTGKELE